jgi:uncharacterized protein YyaL (SSP411 family)
MSCTVHSRASPSSTTGFLDDYAYVIQALIKLYQVTFNEQWIQQAAKLTDHVIHYFHDPSDGFFFYTSSAAEKLITRKSSITSFPPPTPLWLRTFQLGTLLDNSGWKNCTLHGNGPFAHYPGGTKLHVTVGRCCKLIWG